MDKVAELERDLAVHLAECNGRYKVLDEKISGVEEQLKNLVIKMDTHLQAAQDYREKVLHTSAQTKQYLLYGLLSIVAAIVLGPDNGLKLVAALLKGPAP